VIPPNAQQVDHDDVDRAPLEEMAEGHDAVVVLAGRDRRAQRVGDASQAGEVVVRGRVLQPEQLIRLHAATNVDGVHAPQLVDVAHQVDVGPDGVAHDAHALDRRLDGRLAAALHLHLPKAHVHQPGG
jgi:hypothetical protein